MAWLPPLGGRPFVRRNFRLKAEATRLSASDRKGRERALAALAACGFWGAAVPDARPALRTEPRLVQRGDAFKRSLDFADAEQTPASMGRDVERSADVRLQVLEQRLECVQHGLRPLLQRTPDSPEQLTNLPLVVRLASPEWQRRPQRLANLLQELFEGAPRLGGRALNIAVVEPLPGTPENSRSPVVRGPRARGIAPGRELELAPGRRP